MRKKDILPFVATWIDPKDIVLSEISEKDMYDTTYMWNLK